MMAGILHSSAKQDWITPPWLTDRAREVMGSIDLDPCSSSFANAFVEADTFFSPPAEDGLSLPWRGNIWCNPPYGGATKDWVSALIFEYQAGHIKQACLLTNAATDCKWFHAILKNASAICLLYRRVKFLHADGSPGANPTHGSAVSYFGDLDLTFERLFSPHGHVVYTWAGKIAPRVTSARTT